MKTALKKLFLSKITFIICGGLSVIFFVLWGILCMTEANMIELSMDALLYFALIVGLFISYFKGETNMQKALLGALFLLLCNSSIEIFLVYVKANDIFLTVIYALSVVLSVAIFVSHIVLQSDHVGTNKAIFFNQCCGLLILALLVLNIRQAFFVETVSILDLTFIPAWAFTYLVIICIETRVQQYKKIRSEARTNGTWNDDTRKEAKNIFKI